MAHPKNRAEKQALKDKKERAGNKVFGRRRMSPKKKIKYYDITRDNDFDDIQDYY